MAGVSSGNNNQIRQAGTFQPQAPVAVASNPQQNQTGPRKYIQNRMATYSSPFMTPSQVSPNNGYIEQTDEMPATISYQPVNEGGFASPPAVKRGPGCSPFGIVNGFFKGLWATILLLKNTLLTALMILILSLLAFVLILIYKPPLFWNPIKTFLNNDVTRPAVTNNTNSLDKIYERINTTALKDQPVKIYDNELSEIMQEYTFLDSKCFITTKPNSMRFYINVDSDERPLWFITETKINDKDRIEITNAGFGRFDTPQWIAAIMNDTLGLVFQFIEQQVTADSSVAAFKQIITSDKIDKKLIMQKVEFGDGFIVLSYQNNSDKSTEFSY